MEIEGSTRTSVYSHTRQVGFKMEEPTPISTSHDSYRNYMKPTCPAPASAGPCQSRAKPVCPPLCQADTGSACPVGRSSSGPVEKGPFCPPPCHCRSEVGLTCPPPGVEQFCCMQTPRLPSLLPPLRTALYARYNTGDWHAATEEQFKTSDFSLKGAVRYRADLNRIMQDKDQLTRSMQAESRRDIGHRLTDIHYWHSELTQELEQLLGVTCQLKRGLERLQRALIETTQVPLQGVYVNGKSLKWRLCPVLITPGGLGRLGGVGKSFVHFMPLVMLLGTFLISQECLFHREKRMGVDLVHDLVETKLLEEIAMIRCVKEKMKRLAGKVESQLQANRVAQHELEKDLTDKKVAQEIDRKCFNLRNTSEDISYFLGVENIDGTVSVPESWGKFSDKNILHSQCHRAASSRLLEEVENIMEISSREMWSKFNDVNVAFTRRIAEMAETKNRIQVHLAKTLQETCETENAVLMLKQAIKEKELPKKVAQTCLEQRTKRPNVELCRDVPQLKLVNEVHTIDDSIETLKIRMNEAQATLQLLALNRSRLQQELIVKTNSLYIDKEQCMGLRKTFPSTPRLIGYT
ncbi:tektin-5 isoform X1 [Ambystoma mexicanum]|uniref:tektin-5 isoform X1 n=1 Tax=Ambystoma mexicanum TaxID=8296 RepID=UPI0037E86AF1